MGIGPRLLKVASFVPPGAKIGDIGTDHGYLPIYLVEEKIITGAIAADVNPGPLNSARRSIRNKGLEDKIITRLGSGLEVMEPGEIEVATICGMGGKLMVELLKAAPAVVNSLKGLIMQPQQGWYSLRKYLYSIGWHIQQEALVEEDKRLYQVIYAVPGEKPMPSDLELALGVKLLQAKPPLFNRLIQEELAKINRQLEGMSKSPVAQESAEYKKAMDYKGELEGLL